MYTGYGGGLQFIHYCNLLFCVSWNACTIYWCDHFTALESCCNYFHQSHVHVYVLTIHQQKGVREAIFRYNVFFLQWKIMYLFIFFFDWCFNPFSRIFHLWYKGNHHHGLCRKGNPRPSGGGWKTSSLKSRNETNISYMHAEV